ncbi:MAG: aspartate--ammonia ligase [Clostridiales bacterium]|nr:aspartate--ammonia ligase [Clostridiales bacterium]MDY4037238.1 aspartate--ammonia ligase [Candidatus Pseudoscilispira sp.]
MNNCTIPEGYRPLLGLYDTQVAIAMTKRVFEDTLSGALRLRRVSAPLLLDAATGLNDDLNGVERPVEFDIRATGTHAQVVHSLAKWKRAALHRYGFGVDSGIVTDMNAIRRDEDLDNLHSIYVDQWDWEKIIAPEERTLEHLQDTVKRIVGAICDTEKTMRSLFPALNILPATQREITFITTQELEDQYPGLTPKEREDAFVKDHPTTFLMQIGGALRSGKPHDGRAPDYDDWSLNGDLLFWNHTLQRSYEVSSMGIRVNAESLDRQLSLSGCDARRALPFHKALLSGELPDTMGGGIGQSRLCMLLMGSAHIGEVQSSIWDEETRRICAKCGVTLL